MHICRGGDVVAYGDYGRCDRRCSVVRWPESEWRIPTPAVELSVVEVVAKMLEDYGVAPWATIGLAQRLDRAGCLAANHGRTDVW